MEKQRRARDPRRSNYAVFGRRRRRMTLFILVLLAALGGIGAHLFASAFEETSNGALEQVDAPTGEEAPEAPSEEATGKPTSAGENVAEEETAPPPPEDPTLYLTVPRLGVYGHTVRNDRSEAALNLSAIKLPETGFPWQEGANTYIAGHRIGWPGNETYYQFYDLPSMQKGDEVVLADANGTVYEYRVSEVFAVRPSDTWATDPVPGRDVVSLQTCTETPDDWWTIGPRLMESGPESGRLIVRADRVA